jgi:membrane protein DedA with SNARE-associated domain
LNGGFAAAWIVAVISAGGYFGVVILMAIESACIPLPSEIIMPFAGYLVSIGRLSLIGAATAGALGCNLGSTVAYYVGARGIRTLGPLCPDQHGRA